MKLNYEEIKSYYDNGLVDCILKKLNLTGEDIMEILFSHISYIEDELESKEKELSEITDQEYEISSLEDDNNMLRDKVDSLEEDLEALRSSIND